MLISYKKTIFGLYYIVILSSFLQNLDFIPIWLKFIANKIFYLTLILILLLPFLQKKDISLSRKYTKPLIFLFAYFISYLASNITTGISGWMADVIGNGLFYFIAFYVVYISAKNLSVKQLIAPFLMLSSILIFGSTLTLFGLDINFYGADDSIIAHHESVNFIFSLSAFNGLFINQNSYAMMSMCAVIAYLIRLNISERENMNSAIAYYFLMLFWAVITIVMSLSRAAFLGCCIVFILYGILYFKKKQYLFICMIAIPLTFLAYMILAEYFELLYLRVSNDGTSARWDIWVDALNAFQKNILFGVGDYMFYLDGNFLSAHNVYVHVLVSKGLIAFSAWILFWIYFITKAFLNIKNHKSLDRSTVLSSVGLIAILIHQIFESKIAATSAPLTIFSFVLLCLILDGNNSPAKLKIKLI